MEPVSTTFSSSFFRKPLLLSLVNTGPRVFIFSSLLFVIFLIDSEVSARELAETKQIDKKNGVEESKYPYGYGGGYPGYGGYPGGGGGGGYPGAGGGGYPGYGKGGGIPCLGYGCCGGGNICQCCTSAAEAEAYAAAQAKAKPQN